MRILRTLVLLCIATSVLSGCGDPTPGAQPTLAAAQQPATQVAPTPSLESSATQIGGGLAKPVQISGSGLGEATSTPAPGPAFDQPVIASSELVVGPERFVFGLVSSKTGQPVKDVPAVGVQFLKVHEDGTATKVSDGQVVYHNENLPAGLFVVHINFDTAGKWGALFTIRPMGQEGYQIPLNFDVLERGNAPKIGELAPPSKNLTEKDVKDLAEICSTRPHDDMHSMTIADAVKSGKPTLILFATPGFCETATCGPDMEVAQALEKKYAGKANFIHIETPSIDAAPQGHAPVVKEWNLKTEPWIFIVGKDGKIAKRFEGGITQQEVEPEFQEVLSASGS